jgi:hypothetical protein
MNAFSKKMSFVCGVGEVPVEQMKRCDALIPEDILKSIAATMDSK